ncbi:unnamed protein product [Closterium sp. Yama58-4]|nr:unnamed protein product [Closterium sp. Yama58-4]
MVCYEEEADTSSNEPVRRQGGGTSAEVCSVLWHLRRTGECGGMTHGRQPLACGCLLLALLTTCSRQGGHVGQGGKHANLGDRGKKDTWGKEEEATRRHFSTALPAPSLPALTPNPTCTPSSSPSHRRGGRTGSLQRHVRHGHRPPCTSSSSFDAQPDLHSVLIPFPPSRRAHGESTASRSAQGEAEEPVGRVEAERVVPLSLVSPPHGWPRSSLLLVFFLQHRPPCTFSSSFDAQPDLHSVLIPFPPSRRAHGESTASRSAWGEAEEPVGRVEAERVVPLSLVSPPHGWPRSSLLLVFFLQHRPPCTFSSSFDAQPDLHSVLIPFPPSRRAHGESTASRSARAVGRVEAERVVPLSLVSPPHGWPRSSLLLVFFLQHRPPCTSSSSFDAQPDLHSVLIPFPPSRRAHGESTASSTVVSGFGVEWCGVVWCGVHLRRHFRSAGEQQLGGSTPSPTCESLLWQVGGGAEAWRVNTITDIQGAVAGPERSSRGGTGTAASALLLGDAAEARRGRGDEGKRGGGTGAAASAHLL